MIRYTLVRLGYMLVSLLVLITITFFLMKIIPGNPFSSEKTMLPSVKEKIYQKYGLDQPLHKQYVKYIDNILHGDFGTSMKSGREVNTTIQTTFKQSFKLGIVAVIFSVIIGVSLGMIAALKHRRMIDSLAMLAAVIGVSIPSFVLATFLQYIFAVRENIFSVKIGEMVLHLEGQWLPITSASLVEPAQYVLPVLALSALPIAFIARLARSNTLEVLQSDYIKTARAKGLGSFAILRKHVLRNSILPVVTYLGPLTANVVTGSFIIEQIFAINGLGQEYVRSISNRDYSVILGVTIFYAIILIIARFMTDFAYAAIDPRIKLATKKETSA